MNAPIKGHSPLGASGSKRWMTCNGSVLASIGVQDDEDDTFSRPGTAAHELGEHCLAGALDAWTQIGREFNGITIDKEMADAVQIYLTFIGERFPDRNQGNSFIERHFYCPELHKYFYGTADFVFIEGRTLHIIDYKHGAGIVVEVEGNSQTMYYACGALEDLQLWDQIDEVVLWIVQPRGFHYDGPIRYHRISVGDLAAWADSDLLPAMDLCTQVYEGIVTPEFKPGEHCRFCPARSRACPGLLDAVNKLENLMDLIEKKGVEGLSDAQISSFLKLGDVFKIVRKAAEQTAFKRISGGADIDGWKLGKAKSNREWKPGAEAELKKVYGKQAYTEPALKSPAQIEALPKGEDLANRFAFKPDRGLTLVPATDARPAVSRDTKALFKPVKKVK